MFSLRLSGRTTDAAHPKGPNSAWRSTHLSLCLLTLKCWLNSCPNISRQTGNFMLYFCFSVDDGWHRVTALIRAAKRPSNKLPVTLGQVSYRLFTDMPPALRRQWCDVLNPVKQVIFKLFSSRLLGRVKPHLHLTFSRGKQTPTSKA